MKNLITVLNAILKKTGEHGSPESIGKLREQLERCFDLFNLPHFRQIVLENLKQIPVLDDCYLDRIMLDENFYSACPLSVQQQIWLRNKELFLKAFCPLIDSYLKRKEGLLMSIETLKTNFFTIETTKARRQWKEIRSTDLVLFIGTHEELFQTVATYIRELFCKTGDVLLCSLRYELIMAAHDANVENIIKSDPCHDFAWCLEACMRDKHLETHQTNRLRYILDNYPKTSYELCYLIMNIVDLAMISGDVHVIHFLCTMTVKKLRDLGSVHLPRDLPSILTLVRVLSLGCCAKELSCSKAHSAVLDPIFITKFLPELTFLLVEDSIREELLKSKSNLGDNFTATKFLTKPSDQLITFLKANLTASFLWFHCCLNILPSKKRMIDIQGLLRYAEVLPLLKDNVSSSGIWCHLLLHRIINSNQFEAVLLDNSLYNIIIEKVIVENLMVDRFVKYQLLKVINQIGYIWGQALCLATLKVFDQERFLHNGHADMDYFINEYNKLCERLRSAPMEKPETEHEQGQQTNSALPLNAASAPVEPLSFNLITCMSNSNLEPLPFRRPFGNTSGGASFSSRTLAELSASIPVHTDEDSFVDVSGLAKVRQTVTGACRKCGYPGHLPFQCRNYIQLKPGQSTVIDISSTSSESDGETPLAIVKLTMGTCERSREKEVDQRHRHDIHNPVRRHDEPKPHI
ncbi:cofactor of BRCA1 [Dictyocaulus viviparus]|uniref:Cofactor of BRCA1 n=1 Tax=Dictyocaulus viviparus TaxID=29172 RepID=A0A0D8Y0Y0_DICVI|nr:cofactor of BRCA1 [Dictyocaulus viviparus]